MAFTAKKTGTLTAWVKQNDGPNGQMAGTRKAEVAVEAVAKGLANEGKIRFIFDAATLHDMAAHGGAIEFDGADLKAAAQELVLNDRDHTSSAWYDR